MRRLSAILFSVVLTTTAFADMTAGEPGSRLARLGRAMILHPDQPLTETDRAQLAAKGIQVKHVLTEGRYLVRVSDQARVEGESLEPFTAARKIHASAYRAARGRTWADLVVFFHPDVTFDDARTAILAAGGALEDPFATRFGPLNRVKVTVAPASLTSLAEDERVFAVTGRIPTRIQSDNAKSAHLSQVDVVQAAPYGLTGEGVTVSIFELAAAQQDHVEFEGRLTVTAVGGSSSDKIHATHVSGTIGAAGIRPDAKGMAPKVRMYQNCVRTPANDCKNDWLEDKQDALAPLGVNIDNNSWGFILGWFGDSDGYQTWLDEEEYMGAYDILLTAALDDISAEKNILFVHSAGNEGDGAELRGQYNEHRHVDDEGDTITDKVFCYSITGTGNDCPAVTCTGGCETAKHDPKTPYDTIGWSAGAKNILTVGGVDHLRLIAPYSSRGPAKDGRVKPEVVARGGRFGDGVLSPSPGNNYTGSYFGTSMATPVVSGIAALLTEQWRKTFAGVNPRPEQLKALIIAGTEDLGDTGPDYTFGFGLVNAKNSVDLILADAGTGARIRNFPLGQGQTYEVAVIVSEPQDFRAVLNWPDPPIFLLPGDDDIAAKALVNDLDLKVLGPDGTEHLPWKLNKENYTADATRGVNDVDVTEMVDIPNAAAGTYRVVVTGRDVKQGPQNAVLVTSARTAAPCRDVQELVVRNDTPETAFGNLAPNQTTTAGLCTQDDVDFYKFVVTKAGTINVTITTGDTAVRASLSGTGLSTGAEIPAHSTFNLSAPVGSVPLAVTLKIEAMGTRGAESQYSFRTSFGETGKPRRRGVRH